MVSVRACVGVYLEVDARNGTVLLAAHLDVDTHRVSGGVCDELLLARVVIQHRSACHECGVSGQVLYEDVLLGAVSAADSGLYHVYLVFRKPGYPAHDAAHMVWDLCARVDYESAVFKLREADVGLKRCVLYLARLVCGLDYSVSLFKGLVDIAYAAVVGSRNVMQDISVQRELIYHLALSLVSGQLGVVFVKIIRSAGVVLHFAVVDQRSSFCHCLLDRIYGLQRLVFHLDEITCLYRFFKRLSDDGGHAVAHVSYLLVDQFPVVRRGFRVALSRRHVCRVRAVVSRDDLDDSRKSLRL